MILTCHYCDDDRDRPEQAQESKYLDDDGRNRNGDSFTKDYTARPEIFITEKVKFLRIFLMAVRK